MFSNFVATIEDELETIFIVFFSVPLFAFQLTSYVLEINFTITSFLISITYLRTKKN